VGASTFFWFALLLKLALTAGIIVTASLIVERSGPFIGALVASLPTSAGAAYIILSLQHPPAFIAASTVGTLAANAAVAVFSLTYAYLARGHGVVLSLGAAIVAWSICAVLLNQVTWTLVPVVILNVVVYSLSILLSAPLRRTEPPPHAKLKATPSDILWRALTVGVFIAVVTTISEHIGPSLSGMLAIFPVAMASFMVILHPRVGGAAAGAVLAHAQAPLLGLVIGFALVNLTTERIGVWWALLLGLAACLAWNALLWLVHRRRMHHGVQ
jgi:hypothetical protein